MFNYYISESDECFYDCAIYRGGKFIKAKVGNWNDLQSWGAKECARLNAEEWAGELRELMPKAWEQNLF